MLRTKTEGPSRSQAIREYMRKNAGAVVQQIVEGLQAEGVAVTPGLVYQVKAAGRKKRAAKRAMKKDATVKAAASTNGTGTKADEIREAARSIKKPIRPRDVVAALKERGIDVSRAQVSQVLARMGMKRKRRGRRKGASGSAAPSTNSISIDDLVAAKKLVSQVGSIEKVKEALSALARLN